MLKEIGLHVVAFNIPYPPDYGGIIDIYYKLKALDKLGIKIILHTFKYERPEADQLEAICEKVYYYPRRSGLKYFFNPLPYIVCTRNSEQLKDNLLSDKHPVLLEGLHSSLYLPDLKAANKKVFVRTHNIEHNYYKMLAKSERNILRRAFFNAESRKLRKYEPILREADHLFSISTTDTSYFNSEYKNSIFISAFHQNEEIESKTGKGEYILFHGNLSVPENEKALLYLVKRVLTKVQHRVIIAGKNPGSHIKRICSKFSNIELIPNPEGAQMHKLVRDAHINLLYTYQPTGLKLKLLHSLYAGKYCMANPLMLSGSNLDNMCQIYKTTSQAIKMIEELMEKPFSQEEIDNRTSALMSYANKLNAEKIISLI